MLVHIPSRGYSWLMTTETTQREVARTPQVAAQIASFRRDPPLHGSFPLQLDNGATVPEFIANCGHCGQRIDPAMVRGRVVTSLPTVREVAAHGYCVSCQRLIPLTGRFRAVGASVQFEYPDGSGHWRVQQRKADQAKGPFQSMLAKAGALFGSVQE